MEYNDWPENFPPVTSLVPYTSLRHNSDPKIKELYEQAKNNENIEAAVKLIEQLMINEGKEKVIDTIKSISSAHPNAILVTAHAVEGKGRNAIPHTLAHFIGKIGDLEVDNSIVQSNIVSKTGITSTWYRFAHRPHFEGDVQQGRDYILVDDVFSAGGTFSELRAFIEKNGGTVVNSITMANGSKNMNTQLAVTDKHILELENKYGVKSLQQFLKEESLYEGNHKSLTDAEARTILGAASLDEARDKIAAARQKGIRRIRPEMVGGKFSGRIVGEVEVDEKIISQNSIQTIEKQIETARKIGYVQGVCECVAAIGDNLTLGKKLLSEMNVNKETAKKYAKPETYKTLEQGVFSKKHEQLPDKTIKR